MDLEIQVNRRGYLTCREAQVMRWMTAGKTSDEIAVILDCSAHTVTTHIENVRRKLSASNRVHLLALAVAKGIIKVNLVAMLLCSIGIDLDIDMRRAPRRPRQRRPQSVLIS